MEITLINPMSNRKLMEQFCYIYEVCYEKSVSWDNRKMKYVSKEIMEEYLDKRISEGHMNGLETVMLTFSIRDISRILSHQLVRHRHASFSQLSQRYQSNEKIDLILPTSIKNLMKSDDGMLEEFKAFQLASTNLINLMHRKGIKDEDVRFMFMQGQSTNLTFSVNFHALLKIMEIRLCVFTQREFWTLMQEIKRIVAKQYPFMTKHMRIKCEKSGFCDETRNSDNLSCRIRPYKKPDYLVELSTNSS